MRLNCEKTKNAETRTVKGGLFKPTAFFAAFVVGTIAAVLFWKFIDTRFEIQVPAVVQEEEVVGQPQQLEETKLDYDKARYDEIKSIIRFLIENRKDQIGKLKVTFDEASNLLLLENVSWNDAEIPSESRTGGHIFYHFRGFYLFLSLEKRIPDDSSRFGPYVPLTNWIFYISGFELQIDGINDPKERMRIHREEVLEDIRRSFEGFRERPKKQNPRR